MTAVLAFVQARMTSRRFPGKVLAPLHGKPLVGHVVDAVGAAIGAENLIVTTSVDPSDDPLVAYLESRSVRTFRGPLHDVWQRFRLCAGANPSEWIVRVCADSPLLDPAVIRNAVDAIAPELDVVTNAFPRTSPHGQSIELVRTQAFLGVDESELDDADREHVMPFFYARPDRFALRSLEGDETTAGERLVVDTVEDLLRLEERAWS